jgi:hypothetical protein
MAPPELVSRLFRIGVQTLQARHDNVLNSKHQKRVIFAISELSIDHHPAPASQGHTRPGIYGYNLDLIQPHLFSGTL